MSKKSNFLDTSPNCMLDMKELESRLRAWHVYFEGRETEDNWVIREKALRCYRNWIRGPIPWSKKTALGWRQVCFPLILEDCRTSMKSLRTTLSTLALVCLQELYCLNMGLGYFDTSQISEAAVTDLCKMFGVSKKISLQHTSRTLCVILQASIPSRKVIALIQKQIHDKSFNMRICVLVAFQQLLVSWASNDGPYRKAFQQSATLGVLLDSIEDSLKTLLFDANPQVRDTARDLWWCLNDYSETLAGSVFDALDANAQKLVLRHRTLFPKPAHLEKIQQSLSPAEPILEPSDSVEPALNEEPSVSELEASEVMPSAVVHTEQKPAETDLSQAAHFALKVSPKRATLQDSKLDLFSQGDLNSRDDFHTFTAPNAAETVSNSKDKNKAEISGNLSNDQSGLDSIRKTPKGAVQVDVNSIESTASLATINNISAKKQADHMNLSAKKQADHMNLSAKKQADHMNLSSPSAKQAKSCSWLESISNGSLNPSPYRRAVRYLRDLKTLPLNSLVAPIDICRAVLEGFPQVYENMRDSDALSAPTEVAEYSALILQSALEISPADLNSSASLFRAIVETLCTPEYRVSDWTNSIMDSSLDFLISSPEISDKTQLLPLFVTFLSSLLLHSSSDVQSNTAESGVPLQNYVASRLATLLGKLLKKQWPMPHNSNYMHADTAADLLRLHFDSLTSSIHLLLQSQYIDLRKSAIDLSLGLYHTAKPKEWEEFYATLEPTQQKLFQVYRLRTLKQTFKS